MSEPFIAEIKMTALNFAPRGWAKCDGALLPISQNTALFSLLGTTFGGDGRTTLGLPGLRGRAPMHPGRGPGLSSRRLGQKGGTETVTLTTAQLPNHDHTGLMKVVGSLTDQTSPVGNSLAQISGRGGFNLYDDTDNQGAMAPDALAQTGGGQPHDNMQPFAVVCFVIALQGIFPSRN